MKSRTSETSRTSEVTPELAPGDPATSLRLIEELRQYQFELQQQNEELRRTHHELSIAILRYQDLWHNAPVGYVTYQRNGLLLEANHRAAQLLSRYEPLVKGTSLQSCFTPESATLFQQHLWTVIGTGKPSKTQLQVLRSELSDPVWILMETTLDRGGEFRSAIIDISQQRKTEFQNRCLQEQLQQTQRLDMLHNLSGGIAHEFNNILQVILAYGEILQQSHDPNSETNDNISEITKAARRGANLTNRLLVFSRKSHLQKQTVDLNDVVENLLDIVRRTISENVVVESKRSAIPLPVSVDVTLIQQAIMNLCVNARDAMPEGGSLYIETKMQQIDERLKKEYSVETGTYAVITIRDTGSGMTPETKVRAFEPFFTTKAPGQGTGMGLAIVYGIIRQHQGSIQLDSSPGQGASFKIFLPLENGKVIPDPHFELVNPSVSLKGKGDVLLVEDEAAIRELIRKKLVDIGFHVVVASDGAEAIQLIQSSTLHFDLLITDAVMPYVSGRDVCMAFKQSFPKGRAVVMTGYGEQVLDQEFLDEHADVFLKKPFTISDLFHAVVARPVEPKETEIPVIK